MYVEMRLEGKQVKWSKLLDFKHVRVRVSNVRCERLSALKFMMDSRPVVAEEDLRVQEGQM